MVILALRFRNVHSFSIPMPKFCLSLPMYQDETPYDKLEV